LSLLELDGLVYVAFKMLFLFILVLQMLYILKFSCCPEIFETSCRLTVRQIYNVL